MPTKRSRPRPIAGVTPAELEWLTGEPQAGANRWWQHKRGAEKLARCRELIEHYAHLIPAGRLEVLARDLEHWGGAHQGITR